MHSNTQNQDSLCDLVREILPEHSCYNSIQQLLLSFEQLESNLQNLEKRLRQVQQEVEILIEPK